MGILSYYNCYQWSFCVVCKFMCPCGSNPHFILRPSLVWRGMQIHQNCLFYLSFYICVSFAFFPFLKQLQNHLLWIYVCLSGYETVRSLAFHGAHVVMACRNIESANECRNKILQERPKAHVVVMKIDLASLNSVKEFAEEYKQKQW